MRQRGMVAVHLVLGVHTHRLTPHASLSKVTRVKLKELSLRNNHIWETGMAALAEAIAREGAFPSLTEIGLDRNPASNKSNEAVEAVEEALEKKKQQRG